MDSQQKSLYIDPHHKEKIVRLSPVTSEGVHHHQIELSHPIHCSVNY